MIRIFFKINANSTISSHTIILSATIFESFMEKMNTEGKELRTRVLVGLSGGKHSYMAAYLLKIQKYDVMAAI